MRKNAEWFSARVAGTLDVAADIREITLDPGDRAPGYPPGAHVDVRVRAGTGTELRSYSLIGQPERGLWRIAVKHAAAGRGGSRYMWSLVPGRRAGGVVAAEQLRVAGCAVLAAGGGGDRG